MDSHPPLGHNTAAPVHSPLVEGGEVDSGHRLGHAARAPLRSLPVGGEVDSCCRLGRFVLLTVCHRRRRRDGSPPTTDVA